MLPPINISQWMKEGGAELLKPPVNNYCLYKTENYTVMLVGGPNKRSDYHINPTDELFYQQKGEMLLKIVEKSDSVDEMVFRDIVIREGDLYMLPGNTPHNPVRFADTVGVVVEVPRKLDTLRWYCENTECRAIVFQESFYCTDLGTQLKPVIEGWANDIQKRKCLKCGLVNSAK